MDESYENYNNGDDDENVDESAHGIAGHETKCPEDEEDDGEGH